jgi:hypothetical protein
MSYKDHAISEFKALGWVDSEGEYNCEMQQSICEDVLRLLDVFAEAGHSGSTAPYAINLFSRLAKFEPIAPLTGDDSEWIEVDQDVYQNRRMSSVFKQPDRFNGQAYWIEGVIFWEWVSYPDIDRGVPYKSYFTSSESRVPITFPWVKPEPEYRFRPTDEFPHEMLSAAKETK